jgi:hypothetical protein
MYERDPPADTTLAQHKQLQQPGQPEVAIVARVHRRAARGHKLLPGRRLQPRQWRADEDLAGGWGNRTSLARCVMGCQLAKQMGIKLMTPHSVTLACRRKLGITPMTITLLSKTRGSVLT